jgi:hypothetical protein
VSCARAYPGYGFLRVEPLPPSRQRGLARALGGGGRRRIAQIENAPRIVVEKLLPVR